MMLCSLLSKAQEAPKWINNVKLSGFGIVQYQYNGMHNNKSNTFNLRLGRVSLDGRILNDWYWKAQLQFNGNTSTLGASPRVVDLFIEWQKYDFFRVKAGQFKNPFTFDNPIHPIDQGFMSVAQSVQKLASFSDRAGAHPSNGRDIGVQIQGDFLKNNAGRNLVHYQVGVFDGQGINVRDVDQQKNIIGGVWVMPVEGMRLGCFGWTGSYARKGTWTDAAGTTHSGVRSLQQRRYAFSAEYKVKDWTVRSEYVHSTGNAFAKALSNTDPKKLHAKARYDMYQPSDGADKQRTQYDLGLDYEFTKSLALSGIYSYVHDRSLNGPAGHPNYSMFDLELSFRF